MDDPEMFMQPLSENFLNWLNEQMNPGYKMEDRGGKIIKAEVIESTYEARGVGE